MILFVLFVVIILGIWFFYNYRVDHQIHSVTIDSPSIHLSVPGKFSYKVLDTKKQNVQSPILFRATYRTDKKSSRPAIVIRQRPSLSQDPTNEVKLDLLIKSLERSLTNSNQDYKLVSSRALKVDHKDAQEIAFTYTEPVKNKVMEERFIIVSLKDKSILYMTFQSQKSKFASYDNQYFQPILKSIKL